MGKNELPYDARVKIIMNSVEKFKNGIIRIRDMLRSPGISITGMDSMRHICIYLMHRHMTNEKVLLYDIPKKFGWENVVLTARTARGGELIAFDLLSNPHTGDCLLMHFDRLFGTTKFSFDIKDCIKHKEILEILDGIDIDDVDCHMDMLGWVYEQHLKTGSSSASRDLGQFFTDRGICKYMTDLIKPKLNKNGVPESMCDPTMGTGGFLTCYIRFFRENNIFVDWSIHQNQIHGCDTDPRVVGVSCMNMFMESKGHRFEYLLQHDSLYNDLTLTGYDNILANMPFGLKGLKHADCCERVKDLKIRGTKSEPLFLQLMMVSLNEGGRCAVIVPDGMLVNTSVCHTQTRKHLLDNFELKRVVRMDGTFFMNTGCRTSILFFEKSGNPTTSIEFWEVSKDETTGHVSEKFIENFPTEELDSNFCLDIRRRQRNDIVDRRDTTLHPCHTLFDLATIEIGGTPSRSKLDYYGGSHIWVSVKELDGREIMDSKEKLTDAGVKNSSVKLVKRGTLLMSFKLSIGKCAIAGVDLYTNEAIAAINTKDSNVVSNKYLFYYLQLQDFSRCGYGSLGNGSMNKKSLAEISIPVPPIEIQQQIVSDLDGVFQAKSLAETMMKNVKDIMVIITQTANRQGFRAVLLKDVLQIVSGKGNPNLMGSGPVPYYKSNGIVGYVSEPLYTGEYIITARTLSIGAVQYVNGPFYPSDNTINFTSKDQDILLNRFFYYWLKINNHHLTRLSSGIKPLIRKSDVADIKMPIPPLNVQQDIVRRLDDLDQQLNTLKRTIESADDNAKLILDAYI